MSENAQKRLRLMTYWLFGTVLIVLAAVLAFAVVLINQNPLIPPGQSTVGYLVAATWQFDLVVVLVAVAVYVIYRWVILPRSEPNK